MSTETDSALAALENHAENVSENIEASTAAILEHAETLIENAQDRIERAEETAQAVTDAAMATALGQRIEQVETECLNRCNANADGLANLTGLFQQQQETISSLQSQLTELQSRPPLTNPATESEAISLTPLLSEAAELANPSSAVMPLADEGVNPVRANVPRNRRAL